jgi:hypothetical protein
MDKKSLHSPEYELKEDELLGKQHQYFKFASYSKTKYGNLYKSKLSLCFLLIDEQSQKLLALDLQEESKRFI